MPFTVNRPEWVRRSERLIATLRLALAGAALLVIWIDPIEPLEHRRVADALVLFYVVYSIVVFQMVKIRWRRWLAIATQAIDLLWIPPFFYFTEGANTPFFPFVVIFSLNAGIRWGQRGALAVTAYTLIVYGPMLLLATPTPLDLNNDLMRLGYFLIVGGLGGYLAEYRRQREIELSTLQSISEAMGSKYETASALTVLIEMAQRAALADVVVGILREPEDGDILMVRGTSDIHRLSEEEAAPFFVAASGPPLAKGTRAVQLAGDAGIIVRFAEADSGLAYPIRTASEIVGAIFFLVRAPRTRRHASDDFLSLLLRHVIPQLESLYALEQVRNARVLEERRRIARDLHDSFIQVLAALGLRLDVLSSESACEFTVEGLRKELSQMRETVTWELQRVRAYLVEMREPLTGIDSLRGMVDRSSEAFHARTGVPVDVIVDAALGKIPIEVVRELAPLLREALTNVEKHARASRVGVSAYMAAQHLTLTVRDDGIGIGESMLSPATPLPDKGHGVLSMRERARLLGGSVSLKGLEAGGAVLTVSVPLPKRI